MSAACPVFGLILRVETAPGVDLEALRRALRTEVRQSRGLVATALDACGSAMAIIGDGFQASDADREVIVAWLSGQPLVATFEVSQLGDVGHAA